MRPARPHMLWLPLLAVAACGGGDREQVKPRRAAVGRAFQSTDSSPQTTPQQTQAPAPERKRQSLAERRRLKEAQALQQQQEDRKGEPDKDKRDYGAELAERFGSPLSCMKPKRGDDVPTRINISLTAKVMPSGAITRGSASSSALDSDELKCVERLLLSRSLAQPIEDAPRTVTATVRLQMKQPAASK